MFIVLSLLTIKLSLQSLEVSVFLQMVGNTAFASCNTRGKTVNPNPGTRQSQSWQRGLVRKAGFLLLSLGHGSQKSTLSGKITMHT